MPRTHHFRPHSGRSVRETFEPLKEHLNLTVEAPCADCPLDCAYCVLSGERSGCVDSRFSV